MQTINNFIIERLKLNSTSTIHHPINAINKHDNMSLEDKNKISDNLCLYFQGKGCYQNKIYKNRLEIVDKFFHSDICEFFDAFNKVDLWSDMVDYIGIDVDDSVIINYIRDHKNELYKEISEFVL